MVIQLSDTPCRYWIQFFRRQSGERTDILVGSTYRLSVANIVHSQLASDKHWGRMSTEHRSALQRPEKGRKCVLEVITYDFEAALKACAIEGGFQIKYYRRRSSLSSESLFSSAEV